MLECWNKNPTKRPDFHTLTSLLDSTLESISGYVQVQMNLSPCGMWGGRVEIMQTPYQKWTRSNVHILHLCRKLKLYYRGQYWITWPPFCCMYIPTLSRSSAMWYWNILYNCVSIIWLEHHAYLYYNCCNQVTFSWVFQALYSQCCSSIQLLLPCKFEYVQTIQFKHHILVLITLSYIPVPLNWYV